ncbi:MAG: HEAT repeat domain-containing protein [Candidatus Scalindua sp.]|nr:HEAT repeat domain-containing protein [Candidatus Scalindua sp.]
MSLFHYLTIGRFEFVEEEAPPNLTQRVLDHFTPGGLKRLDRALRIIEPFKREEIREIEEEVQRRFGLELNLVEYLSEDGLLQIMYMAHGSFESFAEHVALVASERFGAIASDRGRVFEPAKIKEMSQGLITRDVERKRLTKIEDGAERIREIIKAVQRPTADPKWIAIGFAREAADGASTGAIPELINSLQHPNKFVRIFAGCALGDIDEPAKEAIPVITNLLKDPDIEIDSSAIDALGTMGTDAESALLLALGHKDSFICYSAIKALGNLAGLSENGLSMLREIATQSSEYGKAARESLDKISGTIS